MGFLHLLDRVPPAVEIVGGGGWTSARHDRALTHKGAESAKENCVAPTTRTGNVPEIPRNFAVNLKHEVSPANPTSHEMPLHRLPRTWRTARTMKCGHMA